MELWTLGVFLLVLLQDLVDASTWGILCNYCYQAERMEECMHPTRRCRPGNICFIDEGTFTYQPWGGNVKDKSQTRTVYMFSMGCIFYGMCEDGISYGPRSNGYSHIRRQCCCSDRCLESDGVRDGNYDQCSSPVVNLTITDDAWSLRQPLATPLLTAIWTSSSLYLKLL